MSQIDEEIRRSYEYEPETGLLWFVRSGRRRIAGTLRDDGYIQLRVKGKSLRAHRIAWFLYYGKWPDEQLDHVDGNRANNAIINLREVSNTENSWNSKARPDRKIGRNIVACRDKFHVRIAFHGQHIYGGSFETAEDAQKKADELRAKLHGEYASCK